MTLQNLIFKKPFEFTLITSIILILVLKFTSWTIVLIISLALILGFLLYFTNLHFNFSKSTNCQTNTEKQSITIFQPFQSKAESLVNLGNEEFQAELKQIRDFLKNKKAFKDKGLHFAKGILFVGPPGVGKTALAKSLSQEANINFFYTSGAEFAQIFVGSGALQIRQLFLTATKMRPAIIFIDEIDALGKSRDQIINDERAATLNQLLVELDKCQDLLIIAATNKPDLLDKALTRSGRFDKKLYFELPNEQDRFKLLNFLLKNKKHKVNIASLVQNTAGFSPASLNLLINEAALLAFQKQKIIDDTIILAVKIKLHQGQKQNDFLSVKHKEALSLQQAARTIIMQHFKLKLNYVHLLDSINYTELDSLESQEDYQRQLQIALAATVALDLYYQQRFISIKRDIVYIKDLLALYKTNFDLENEFDQDQFLNEQKLIIKKILVAKETKLRQLAKQLLEKEFLDERSLIALL